MKKKIMSFCTAIVVAASCVPSAFAASVKDIITALPKYEQDYKEMDVNVDADIEVQQNNGTGYKDGPISVMVPASNPSAPFDYKATLYMAPVRESFLRYWEIAKVLCTGDNALLTELDKMPVTGGFTVTVEYPDTMAIPNEMLTANQMLGFSDNAKHVFSDPERKIVGNSLVITIEVKNPEDASKKYVEGKQLADNLTTYLGDLTLECKGVAVTGVGSHRITGKITGSVKIGDYVLVNGSAEAPIATVNYEAVQVQEGMDAGKTSIYEDVVLTTPAPTQIPGGGSSGSHGSSTSSGMIAGGHATATPYESPVPSATIVPAEAETAADLDRENHYAYIIGYPEGDVRPAGNITRAEVATIFFRMLTDDSRKALWTTENDYSDVAAENWFNNAISTMSSAGVLKGYDDGTFRPNAPITRAEFAAIIARFIAGRYEGPDKFADISGHWAAEYINRAAHYGWISGYENGTYRPTRDITRAEAMTLVNNVLNRHVLAEGLLDDMVKWQDNTVDQWYYTAVQEATNSHYYDRAEAETAETWTSIRDPRDWAALETELSNADSAGAEESILGE